MMAQAAQTVGRSERGVKTRKAIILAACLLFIATPTCTAQGGGTVSGGFLSRFSIKLTGGVAFLPGGDLKNWFSSETAYDRWLGKQPGYMTQSSYPYGRTVFLPEVEIIWQASRRFGLSAGAGYLRKTWTASSSVRYDFGGALGRDDLRLARRREARVVPLMLSAIYSVPLGRDIKINLQAGLDYHLASFRFADDTTYSWPNAPGQPSYLDHSTTKFEPRAGAVGAHFGVGAERALSSRLSLILDVLYRAAEVRELRAYLNEQDDISWTGHQSSSSPALRNQTLWFGKTTWAGTTYTQAVYAEAKPDWLDGVRALRFGQGGFVLRVGIKIGL
jgi:hypothetical protein